MDWLHGLYFLPPGCQAQNTALYCHMYMFLGTLLLFAHFLQDSGGNTAIDATGHYSNHKSTALLLAAGANPISELRTSSSIIDRATVNGNVAWVIANSDTYIYSMFFAPPDTIHTVLTKIIWMIYISVHKDNNTDQFHIGNYNRIIRTALYKYETDHLPIKNIENVPVKVEKEMYCVCTWSCLFRVMEVLVANAQEHLLNLTPSHGLSLLHLAAARNHTRVCSLLAAEVNMLCTWLLFRT